MLETEWYESWAPTEEQLTFPHGVLVDVRIEDVVEALGGIGLDLVDADRMAYRAAEQLL